MGAVSLLNAYDTPPKYWAHFKEAGSRYGLDPKMLAAIAMHESCLNCTAINRANKNKSIDVGVMQINSWWFKTLSKYTKDLNSLYDPRFNIHIGAWVLKKCTKRYGVTWKAIDCYNKGESKAQKRSKYIRQVNKQYEKIKRKNYN